MTNFGYKMSPETRAKMSASKKGTKNNNWKGGRVVGGNGYVLIYSPNHPHATAQGYVYEHRLVMEAHIGRTLIPTEVVHHVNGIVDDNRIENLMLFSCDKPHRQLHAKIKKSGEPTAVRPNQ